jgi:hypothetical protein
MRVYGSALVIAPGGVERLHRQFLYLQLELPHVNPLRDGGNVKKGVLRTLIPYGGFCNLLVLRVLGATACALHGQLDSLQ